MLRIFDDFATQNFVCIKCHIRKQAYSMPLSTSSRFSPLLVKPSTY